MTSAGHALSGYIAFRAFFDTGWIRLPRKGALLTLCLVLPILPDLDFISFYFGIPYESPFGHRGISHSIGAGFFVAVALAALFKARGWIAAPERNFSRLTLFFTLLWFSHPILDTITDGGKGCMLFFPFSQSRVVAPARFVPVSPVVTGHYLKRLPTLGDEPTAIASADSRRKQLARDEHSHLFLLRSLVGAAPSWKWVEPLWILGIIGSEALVLIAVWTGIVVFRRARLRFSSVAERLPSSSKRRAAIGAALIAFAALIALSRVDQLSGSGTKQTLITLPDSNGTPIWRVEPVGRAAISVRALLIHGSRCSAEMMLPLARTLARNGIITFAVELPGHALSPSVLSGGSSCQLCSAAPDSCREDVRRQLQDAVFQNYTYLTQAKLLYPAQTIVIGHCAGGTIAGDLLNSRPLQLAPFTAVNIDGVPRSINERGNILVLASEGGTPVVERARPDNLAPGSFQTRTARKTVQLNESHLVMIYSKRVHLEILRWTKSAFRLTQPINPPPGNTDPSPFIALLTLSAFLLVYFSLPVIAPAVTDRETPSNSWSWRKLANLGFSGGAASAVLRYGGDNVYPIPQLSLVGPGFVFFLFATGIFATLGNRIFFRSKPQEKGSSKNGLWTALLIPIATFLLIYFTAGAYASRTSFHLQFTPLRLSLFVLYALMLLPITTAIQRVISIDARDSLSVVKRFGCIAIVWWTLFALFGLFCRDCAFSRDLGELKLLIITFELGGVLLFQRLGHRVAPAAFTALMLGWFVSTAYPVVI